MACITGPALRSEIIFSKGVMKNIKIWLILYLITPINLFAFKCVNTNVSGTPKDNPSKNIQSMGTGIVVKENGHAVLKFFSCSNRPKCKDLKLRKLSKHEVPYELGEKITIYTTFKSFEEAQAFDAKANKKLNTRLPPRGFDAWGCTKNYVSILDFAPIDSVKLLLKKHPLEIKPQYKECGECSRSLDNSKKTSKQYFLNGNFFLKNNQLYFNFISHRDNRTLKVKDNFKCAEPLQFFLDKKYTNIGIESKKAFKIENDTLQGINLCEMNLSTWANISNESTYSEKTSVQKIFPSINMCPGPELTDDFIQKAKTIFFGNYRILRSKELPAHISNFQVAVLRITSITTNKKYVTKDIILNGELISKLTGRNNGRSINFFFISPHEITVTKDNAIDFFNRCDSIFTLNDFDNYKIMY